MRGRNPLSVALVHVLRKNIATVAGCRVTRIIEPPAIVPGLSPKFYYRLGYYKPVIEGNSNGKFARWKTGITDC